MSEDRIDELESQLAFQEDLIQKLDDALASQQQQILDLKREIKLLTDHVKQVEGQIPAPEAPEPPPPHY